MKDKGFEVRFRDKTVQIAVNESMSMSVIVQTVYDGTITLRVGGFMSDTILSHTWLSADDLKLGDEIVIERKETEQSSEPIDTVYDFRGPSISELSPEEKENILKYQLGYFHALENKLKNEGLINEE
jgi:hypothetical protein